MTSHTEFYEATDYLDKAAEKLRIAREYVRNHETSDDERAQLLITAHKLNTEGLILRSWLYSVAA
jgi:hypothetical protein